MASVGTPRTGSVGLQLTLSLCLMPHWVGPGRSPAAAAWALTGDNPLAPLQSWEPTGMWSLCFLNMHFQSWAPSVFIVERPWLGIQNLRNFVWSNCQETLVFLSNNLDSRSRRRCMCPCQAGGVLQGYQLDPEIVSQTPLKVSEVSWRKDNEDEQQQSPVPGFLQGSQCWHIVQCPDLLY